MAMKRVHKRMLRSKKILIALVILLVAVLISGVAFYHFGSDIGSAAGTLTGKAVGSFNGIVEGYSSGYESGREDGLNAQDLEMQIKETVQLEGSLQVLEADVTLTNKLSTGDTDQIYLYAGTATFKTNLEEATFEADADAKEMTITIPPIEMDLILDEEKTQLLASQRGKAWDKNAEDGFESFMKSREKVISEAEKNISNYENLVSLAEQAAKQKIQYLAESASLSDWKVTVAVEEVES